MFNLIRAPLFLTLLLCLIHGTGGVARAQDAPPTLAEIERQLVELSQRDDLVEQTRTRAVSALENARGLIRASNERREAVQRLVEQAARSSELREELAAELRELRADETEQDLPETSEGLRSRLNFLQSERSLLQQRSEELIEQQTRLARRPGEIAEEIANGRTALAELEARASDANGEDAGAASEALETLRQARLYAQRTAIEMLQRELPTIAQRQPILAAQIELNRAQLARVDTELNAIQKRLSDVRMDLADTALERALRLEAASSGLPQAAGQFASRNVEYANLLRGMAERALADDLAVNAYTEEVARIRQQAATVNRVVATGRISGEIGALLRQVRVALPRTYTLREAAQDVDYERVSLQLDIVLWQDQQRAAASAEDAVAWINAVSETPLARGDLSEQEVSVLAELVDHRNDLLDKLIEAGSANADRLTDLQLSILATLNQTQELRNTLDRRLFWLPTTTRPWRDLQQNLSTSLQWLASPAQVSQLTTQFVRDNQSRLYVPLLLIAAAAFIVLSRTTLLGALETLNTGVGKVARDRYWTTPGAVLIGGLLALPIPLLMTAFVLNPALENEGNSLAGAIASAIWAAGGLLYLFLAIGIFRNRGVLANHFNWSDKATRSLSRAPAWFLAVFLVALGIVVLAISSQRQDLLQGIGMPAFLVASVCFAILGWQVFRPNDGWLAMIAARGVSPTISFLGLIGFVLVPLVIGVLPLFGYVETATALQARLAITAMVMLAVAVVFGILNRQLLIAQRRLLLRKALQRRAQAPSARSVDDSDESMSAASTRPAPEAIAEEQKRISNQARRVLIYTLGIAGVTIVLTIWASILPALGIANELTLWTGSEIVDGVRVSRPVTLWNLILFFALIGAGTAAAYNVHGLLELGLFQRLNVSAGSRYAIITIISYLLFGVGVVAGFLQLGLDWSRLQWIIAALGVGLGFGLQEIVANFVSGIIILFERPVRVGDFVTIGELEGTVSNIAIRATTITDFDNREVLLPNKSIITENVTNWTLRDSIIRIIIPIGVAYGSDTEQVRALLQAQAEANEDVLETPVPQVFFMSHGDSSLDFEVRVFISNPRKRFRVRHELNSAINKALAEAGVEIPFPQRDLHLRSVSESILQRPLAGKVIEG